MKYRTRFSSFVFCMKRSDVCNIKAGKHVI